MNPATTRRYLDLLTDALMIRQLQPWYQNMGKRQMKSPKIYVRDSGLLHRRFGIECKRADAPRMTPSIRSTIDGWSLAAVLVLYPGIRRDRLADHVEVVPLSALAQPDGLLEREAARWAVGA